jgi:predicted metal-dependent HD superfamily phosphohydrolase
MILLRTAALFHDSGFLYRYENNESIAVDLVRHHGPLFGYNEQDLQIIEELIFATSYHAKPKNLMQEILCDADLDYLGRLDYHSTAEKLFNELAAYGNAYNELERIEMQIHYLESHHTYYTASAKNLRNPGKKKRLKELKNKLKKQLNK